MVIGYGHQGEAPTSSQCAEEDLHPTASGGDGLSLSHVVSSHLGHSGTDQHPVREGELAQQEVHGRVQSRVLVNQQDHKGIAHEGGEGNCRSHYKENGWAPDWLKSPRRMNSEVVFPLPMISTGLTQKQRNR